MQLKERTPEYIPFPAFICVLKVDYDPSEGRRTIIRNQRASSMWNVQANTEDIAHCSWCINWIWRWWQTTVQGGRNSNFSPLDGHPRLATTFVLCHHQATSQPNKCWTPSSNPLFDQDGGLWRVRVGSAEKELWDGDSTWTAVFKSRLRQYNCRGQTFLSHSDHTTHILGIPGLRLSPFYNSVSISFHQDRQGEGRIIK